MSNQTIKDKIMGWIGPTNVFATPPLEDFIALGPDAPTLCEGWDARDLAAHIRLREARPDASLGVLGGPVAGWTKRVQDSIADQPYEKLVDSIRNGPPFLSLYRVPGLDAQLNLVEFVVHHEDLRRGQDDWTERELAPDLADFLWERAQQIARAKGRSSRRGLRLVRTDGAGGSTAVSDDGPVRTVTGPALELLLYVFGRRAVHVDIAD